MGRAMVRRRDPYRTTTLGRRLWAIARGVSAPAAYAVGPPPDRTDDSLRGDRLSEGTVSPAGASRHSPPARTRAPTAGSEPAALVEFLQILRRRRVVVLACAVAAVAIGVGVSALAPTRYTATAKLYFHDPMLTEQLFGSTVIAPTQDPTRAGASDLELLQLHPVAQLAASSLPRLTAGQVASKVAVTADGQSDLFSVVATDHDPHLAAAIASAYAAAFVSFRRNLDRGTVTDTLSLITKQENAMSRQERLGPVGRALRAKASQLRILESLQTGNVYLVQAASVPTSASFPKPVQNVVLGLVAGLLIGLGLSVIVDRLDQRLRDPLEAQSLFGRPVLGFIPSFRDRNLQPTPIGADPRALEAFRMLRTNLRYFQLGGRVSVVVLTSPEPGDGKTTVAWNLAAAAAGARERALLIEADLRRPLPSAQGTPGLVHVLLGDSTLTDALATQSTGRDGASFDVLYAGGIPPNPADLFESEAMTDLLRSVRDLYDLVILDCTPITYVSDSIPLLRAADGAIIVASVAKTSRESCRRLRSELEELGAAVLGVVANRVKVSESTYGDYYLERPAGREGTSGTPAAKAAPHSAGRT